MATPGISLVSTQTTPVCTSSGSPTLCRVCCEKSPSRPGEWPARSGRDVVARAQGRCGVGSAGIIEQELRKDLAQPLDDHVVRCAATGRRPVRRPCRPLLGMGRRLCAVGQRAALGTDRQRCRRAEHHPDLGVDGDVLRRSWPGTRHAAGRMGCPVLLLVDGHSHARLRHPASSGVSPMTQLRPGERVVRSVLCR